MTHTSHTKPDFNTVSSLLTNIKSIGANSLLVTMFALFTMIASMRPAQAELVDLSNPEPVIQFASREASWLKPPTFDRAIRHNPIGRYLIHCSYDENGAAIKPCDRTDLKIVLSLRVDKQGSIKNIKVKKRKEKRVLWYNYNFKLCSTLSKLIKEKVKEVFRKFRFEINVLGKCTAGNSS